MMCEAPPNEVRRDRVCAAGLFVICAAGYAASAISYHADTMWALHTALSFARGHWGDLSIFPVIDAVHDRTVFRHGDHVYMWFPIGTSLLLAPLLWLLDRLAPGYVAVIAATNPQWAHRLAAAAICATAVAVFYAAARERFERPAALVLALLLAFCTPMWSTASRTLWTHGPLVLAYCTALLLVLRADRRPALAVWAAVPLAIGFMVRPTAAIGIVGITALVAINHRHALIGYLLCLGATLAPWIALNLTLFDAPLATYYMPARLTGSSTVGEALLGNLLSPARGLLVFSPVLLLAVPGFALALREPGQRALAVACGAIVVAHWIMISRFPHWWGGYSIGPRLMSDIVPFAVLLAGYALAAIARLAPAPRRIAAAAIAALALASAAIHGSAATMGNAMRWNSLPSDVDAHPERLWDWRDPQVLAALRRWRGLP